MTSPGRIVVAVAALVIVAFVVYRAADAVYLQPKQDLRAAIAQHENNLATFRNARNTHLTTDEDLQDAADRTLGDTREIVEAELRTRLNRIAAEVGLGGAVVSTGSPVAVRTPARRQLNSQNPYRDDPDFVEVPGTISGTGSWRQVLSLIDRVQTCQWVWRVNAVTLDPDQQGEPFDVRLQLTTVYFPGRPPTEPLPPSMYRQDARMLALASTNPFKLPAPPEPEKPVEVTQQSAEEETPPPQPPPPSFDYGAWRLTMVTQTGRGAEAWLLNTATGERRTLTAGDSLHELVFRAATSDDATFNLNDTTCRVAVGASLADRRPVMDTETEGD